MPIPTPFYSRTAPLCKSHQWRNWSGFLAPITYEPTHEYEYYAIRNSAALIDVSPLFKCEITGADAARLLDRVITRDVSKCDAGQVLYTSWCDEDGKMIDDGTVQRLEADQFRVTAANPSLRWLQDCGLGMDVTVRNITEELAALALQGPSSRAILHELTASPSTDTLRFFRLVQTKIAEFPVTVSRTGYTGDLGYELWVHPRHAEKLWDLLMEAGQGYGIAPCGLAAMDIARIEAGLLLIEVDYISSVRALTEARKSSPYEAGLGWTVKLEKDDFIGKRALQIEKERGAKWQLVGLEVDWDELECLFAAADLPPLLAGQASRQSVPIFKKGRQIGQATSHTFSPILKKYIALATIESRYAKEGVSVDIEVTVEFTRQRAAATVVATPFFNPDRKRS